MIKIAVIGLPQSGKSSLSQALQHLADAGAKAMQFVEVHNPDELHGHAYDVVLQVVDSTRLEESLLLTPHIIDEQQKIVLAIGRYDLLLQTDHSLNIPKLQENICSCVPAFVQHGAACALRRSSAFTRAFTSRILNGFVI